MSDINTLSFGYVGHVELSISVNGKVFKLNKHNAAEPYLKRVFAKMLIGLYNDSCDRPESIMLKCKEEGSEVWKNYLTSSLPVSGSELTNPNNSGQWTATFTAVIPYASLIAPVDESTGSLFKLYLRGGLDTSKYNNEDYHELASIALEPADLAAITPGTQAIVKWSMRLVDVEED